MHPDFEDVIGRDPGIVQAELGDDGKPVYAGAPFTATTHGKDAFDPWYRDVPGVNLVIPVTLGLKDQGGGMSGVIFPGFFPIDDLGFGNEGRAHDFHFTLELHALFTYESGALLSVAADDDAFVFINGKLALDLGGAHPVSAAGVSLDARAQELGLTPGQVYPLDVFFAERHTPLSSFGLITTIPCFTPKAK